MPSDIAPAQTAAPAADVNVELVARLGYLQGLDHDHLESIAPQVLLDGATVDDDLPGTGAHTHTRDGGLTAAGGLVSLLFSHVLSLLVSR